MMNDLATPPSSELPHPDTPPPLQARERLPKLGPSFGWMALFLATFFLAALVYIIGYGVSLGIEFAAQGITEPDQQVIEARVQEHLQHPNGIVGVYLVQCLMLIPLVLIASHFPQQSWRETLAVRRFDKNILLFWLMVWLGYLVLGITLTRLFDIDPGDFMRSLSNSDHLPVALVLIFCAPLLEELVFRGYLFKAWRHTRLGLSGTLLLTSLFFTLLHGAQYNWVLLTLVFVLSMILGLAREKSGSLWVPLTIHAAHNCFAVITIIYFGWL